MPLYENGALYSYIVRHPELAMLTRVKFCHDVSAGMVHLHSRGVIHGDLKGDNVLIDGQLNCAISDFGLAHLKGVSSFYSKRPGHATRWIAPERYKGGYVLDSSFDLFSFAMTCYQILTGELPFQKEPDEIVKDWYKDGERPEWPTHVPNHIQAIISACWAHDPKSRPSMEAVLSQLSRYLKEFGKEAPSVKPSDAVDSDYRSRSKSTESHTFTQSQTSLDHQVGSLDLNTAHRSTNSGFMAFWSRCLKEYGVAVENIEFYATQFAQEQIDQNYFAPLSDEDLAKELFVLQVARGDVRKIVQGLRRNRNNTRGESSWKSQDVSATKKKSVAGMDMNQVLKEVLGTLGLADPEELIKTKTVEDIFQKELSKGYWSFNGTEWEWKCWYRASPKLTGTIPSSIHHFATITRLYFYFTQEFVRQPIEWTHSHRIGKSCSTSSFVSMVHVGICSTTN
jgi:hypothetical protein